MTGVQHRKLLDRDREVQGGVVWMGGSWLQRALGSRSLEGRHVGVRGGLPRGATRVQIGSFAHRVALRIVLEQRDNRFCDGARIVKRDKHASLVREQFLGVQVRRGDDCLASSKRDGQRSGDNLCFLPVGRDVNIRRAYLLNQFFSAYETIVENQMG